MNDYVRQALAARHPFIDKDYFAIYNRINSDHLFVSFHSAAQALLEILTQDKITKSTGKTLLSTFEINTIEESIVTMIKQGLDSIAANDTVTISGDMSDIELLHDIVEVHEGDINTPTRSFIQIPLSFIVQELSFAFTQLYGPREERVTKMIVGSYYNLMYCLYQLALPDEYNTKIKNYYKSKVDSCMQGVSKSEYIWYTD